MCIALYADQGPIRIDFMLESIQPIFGARSLMGTTYRQTFDLIIRNLGNQPIKTLTLVHPTNLLRESQRPGEPERILDSEVIAYGRTIPNWEPRAWDGKRMYRADPVDLGNGLWKLPLQDTFDGGDYDVSGRRWLTARKIDLKSVRMHPLITPRVFEMFTRDWPTVMQIHLDGEMEPYDPEQRDRRYLVQLSLRGVPTVPRLSQDIRIGARTPIMRKRTFAIRSPQLVWEVLESLLISARDRGDAAQSKLASGLFDLFIERGRNAAEHAANIFDLRIGIVTGAGSFMMDCQEAGQVKFVETRPLRGNTGAKTSVARDRWEFAHVWLAGHKSFPNNDPLALTRAILNFFHADINRSGLGRTREEIAVAIHAASTHNVRLLLDMLSKPLKYLKEDRATGCWLPTNRRTLWAPQPWRRDDDWERKILSAFADMLADGRVFHHEKFQLYFSAGVFGK